MSKKSIIANAKYEAIFSMKSRDFWAQHQIAYRFTALMSDLHLIDEDSFHQFQIRLQHISYFKIAEYGVY